MQEKIAALNSIRLIYLFTSLFMIWRTSGTMAQSKKALPSEKNDSVYTIGIPGTSLEIDARKGARISSLKIGGQEFLYVNKTADNWGATFWTSPQSAWGWPPLQEHNSKPYAEVKKEHGVMLAGKPDAKLGVAVQKEFRFNQKDTSFSIRYTLVNTSKKTVLMAPWEITRVPPGGMTIFPKGKGNCSGDLAPLMIDSIGCVWFSYQAQLIPQGIPKLFSDGAEGWLAQVYGNKILIQKFKDLAPGGAAPQEAEIELYANPDHSYLEIEHQGAYVAIATGTKTRWNVTWYGRTLPANLQGRVGSAALVAYIRKMVQ